MEKKLLTAAELMARSPREFVVDCQSWCGPVRMLRLPGPEKLRVSLQIAGLTKDGDGKVSLSDSAAWGFAVDLLADSIVDEDGALQFAEPSSLAWLAAEVAAVSELLGPCLRLNGLGEAEQAAELEAAKND